MYYICRSVVALCLSEWCYTMFVRVLFHYVCQSVVAQCLSEFCCTMFVRVLVHCVCPRNVVNCLAQCTQFPVMKLKIINHLSYAGNCRETKNKM